MPISEKELRLKKELIHIEREIKEAESQRSSGTVLMIVSLFVLWPLFIVGIIKYSNANKKYKELLGTKKKYNGSY